MKHYPDGETIRGDLPDHMLEQVTKRLGKEGDLNDVLHNATINAILQKPENPGTERLFQATLSASPDVTPPLNQTMDDPNHGMGGLTSLLRLFTHANFEKMVTKLTSLFQSSVALVLACFVFYASESSKVLKSETNKVLMFLAGALGIVYTSCLAVDSIFRSKVKSIRCFGEIGILCGYVSYWLLVPIVFGPWSLVALLVTLVIFGLGAWQYMKNRPLSDGTTIRGDVPDSRLEKVILRLGRKPKGLNSVLHSSTINAILQKPEHPDTDILYKATLSSSPETLEVKNLQGVDLTPPIYVPPGGLPPFFMDNRAASDGTTLAVQESSSDLSTGNSPISSSTLRRRKFNVV